MYGWIFPPLNNLTKERTGYRTQKPLALYSRIIKTSTNEGDIVLDPFCGCATTCVAAEVLQRNWIGIDVSEKADFLIRERLKKEIRLSSFNVNHIDVLKNPSALPVRKTNVIISKRKDLLRKLYMNQDGKCNHCGISATLEQAPSFFDIDHIVPKSKGGSDGDHNKQLLCSSCNRKKGNKDDRTAKALLEAEMKELGIT